MGPITPDGVASTGGRKWWVCGLLLLALMLNYMDRQTLSLTIVPISNELGLTNTQYGLLEKGFGYAFALGGLIAGFLADKIGVRWMYPLVLLGWSAAGVATGFADRIGSALLPWFGNLSWLEGNAAPEGESSAAFLGFLCCRIMLGFFEAGQWPCALITTQRLLAPADRPLGNSVLQSGASIGAILTPLVVQLLVTERTGSWRLPYVVIGVIGLLWIFPWMWVVAGVSLERPVNTEKQSEPQVDRERGGRGRTWTLLIRRYLALVAVVITINLTWQFFRAWLPKMLEEFHGYSASSVRLFISAYYISTDVGCIAAGAFAKWLTSRGRTVHTARTTSFLVCAALTALSTVAAGMERGPWLMLTLLVIGFGSLGLFPTYYSLTQELSSRHQGKVTGTLGFITWIVSAEMQQMVGAHVDATKSYSAAVFWLGLAPAIGLVALLLLWGRDE